MIRLAKSEDIPIIAKIHVDEQKRIYKGIFNDDYLESLNYSRSISNWSKSISREGRILFVDEIDGCVEAFASLLYSSDVDGFATVDYLYVSHKKQGQGIGTELLNYCFDYLKKQGYDGVCVYCVDGNSMAENFYRKKGFLYKSYKMKKYTGMPTRSNLFVKEF